MELLHCHDVAAGQPHHTVVGHEPEGRGSGGGGGGGRGGREREREREREKVSHTTKECTRCTQLLAVMPVMMGCQAEGRERQRVIMSSQEGDRLGHSV